MHGAIAAGNRHTAEAGARVLAEGGNAVDACIGAAFAAAVAEGPLTGPAGGGFLLAWVGGEATVLDCFFAAPTRPLGAMEEIVVDFGDASTQTFHVGDGSVAVPGLIAGLEEAHRRFGTVPWPELVDPAIELAAAGVEKSDAQRALHLILTGILGREDAGRRIYGDPDRIETAPIVPTLERVRDARRGAVAELLPELVDDLAAYRVAAREPIRARLGDREILTTPPPSRGGTIVAAALELLAGAETLDERARALLAGYAAAPLAVAGTTHISVLDAAGNAASLSSTLGSGSGLFRGGTQLNNMLGELDVIGLSPPAPGHRLPSMMAPTLVLEDGRARLALGSAGSVRLAGAIAQVADGVFRGLPVQEAIDRPRIHAENDVLHLEAGVGTEAPDGWQLVRWAARNLFFGGVSAVERRPDGTLAAAGDPRRGGHGIVVG